MFKDTLAQLKAASEGRLDEVKGKVASAEAEVASFDTLSDEAAEEIKAKEDAAYKAGYAKGEADSGTPGAGFTLEEVEAKVKEAVDPLNAKLSEKNVQLESMKADLDAAKKEIEELKSTPPVVEPGEPTVPTEPSAEVEELKAQVASLVKERDDLRGAYTKLEDAVKIEIDDAKKDTSRLEKAIAPIELPPVTEVPEVPETPVDEAAKK